MSPESGIKRLYRSRHDKVIGGVAGGLGDYLGVDPVILRLIFLATVLLGGSGVLAYLIAWILIPEEPLSEEESPAESKSDGAKVVGVILIVIALIWLAGRFGLNHMFIVPWGWVGPIALVALGIAMLLRPTTHSAPETAAAAEAEEAQKASKAAKEESAKALGDTSSEPRRQLRRSRYDRVLFGVCGGIAKHMNTDSTLVRVLFAIATVFSAGLVIIIYLFLGLVLPEEDLP